MTMNLQTENVVTETYFDNIPISKMFVAEYGRPSSPAIVNKLKNSFDIKAVGTLYLSYREDTDTYAIIDGHHRMLAATEHGFTMLPARIYLGLTIQQEAYLYNLFATVNKQMALDRFRARLIAGDEETIQINEVVANLGLSIANDGEVKAVGAIVSIVKDTNLEHFRKILELLHEVYGNNQQAYRAEVLLGISAFLARYEKVADRERVVETLKKYSPRDLFLMAQTAKRLMAKADQRYVVGIYLMEEYNKGLKTSKLPSWKARKSTKPFEFTEARKAALKRAQEKKHA